MISTFLLLLMCGDWYGSVQADFVRAPEHTPVIAITRDAADGPSFHVVDGLGLIFSQQNESTEACRWTFTCASLEPPATPFTTEGNVVTVTGATTTSRVIATDIDDTWACTLERYVSDEWVTIASWPEFLRITGPSSTSLFRNVYLQWDGFVGVRTAENGASLIGFESGCELTMKNNLTCCDTTWEFFNEITEKDGHPFAGDAFPAIYVDTQQGVIRTIDIEEGNPSYRITIIAEMPDPNPPWIVTGGGVIIEGFREVGPPPQ